MYRIRGHKFTVSRENFKDNFFTRRVVIIWNDPLEVVMEEDTIKTLKQLLDSCLERKAWRDSGLIGANEISVNMPHCRHG